MRVCDFLIGERAQQCDRSASIALSKDLHVVKVVVQFVEQGALGITRRPLEDRSVSFVVERFTSAKHVIDAVICFVVSVVSTERVCVWRWWLHVRRECAWMIRAHACVNTHEAGS